MDWRLIIRIDPKFIRKIKWTLQNLSQKLQQCVKQQNLRLRLTTHLKIISTNYIFTMRKFWCQFKKPEKIKTKLRFPVRKVILLRINLEILLFFIFVNRVLCMIHLSITCFKLFIIVCHIIITPY